MRCPRDVLVRAAEPSIGREGYGGPARGNQHGQLRIDNIGAGEIPAERRAKYEPKPKGGAQPARAFCTSLLVGDIGYIAGLMASHPFMAPENIRAM